MPGETTELIRQDSRDTVNSNNDNSNNNDDDHHNVNSKLTYVAGHVSAILGTLMMSASLCCAQALGESIPGFQLNLWRFSAQFVFCLPIILYRHKTEIFVIRGVIPYLALVCLSYSVANWTYYGSSRYQPVGAVGCMHPSIYLLSTAIVAFAITREFRLYLAVAVIVCIIGVVLATQPEFLFKVDHSDAYIVHPFCPQKHIGHKTLNGIPDRQVIDSNDTYEQISRSSPDFEFEFNASVDVDNSGWIHESQGDIVLGYVYITVTPLILTLVTFVVGGKLSDTDPFVTSFWIGASGVGLSLSGMTVFETPLFPDSSACQGLLVSHAISASLCNIFRTIAMTIISPISSALITTLEIVFLFCAQYTVLSGVIPGHRNDMEVIGTVVVLLGNVISPLYLLLKNRLRSGDDGNTERLEVISDK